MFTSFPLRVGLTGGIGSGKSTVASLFRQFSIPVIDFDQIAKDLTQGSDTPALQQIRKTFGVQVFQSDHTLSRSRLRELVFQSQANKKQLENILHPLIREKAQQQYDKLAATSPIIVFDMPLLAESNEWQKGLDKILVIDCDETTQIQRVIARSGWSEKEIRAVIASQASRSQRLAIATDVIINNDISIDELKNQVRLLLHQWLQPPALRQLGLH